MDETTQQPIAPAPQLKYEPPKRLHRSFQIPGTTYLKQRRMRPLFFGWFCGLLTINATMLAIGILWFQYYTNNYSSYSFTNFPYLYYGATILAVVTVILLLIITTIGLPILYGHVYGVKQVIKIIIHETIFLAVVLAVLFILSVRFTQNYQPQDYGQCNAISSCLDNGKSL